MEQVRQLQFFLFRDFRCEHFHVFGKNYFGNWSYGDSFISQKEAFNDEKKKGTIYRIFCATWMFVLVIIIKIKMMILIMDIAMIMIVIDFNREMQ